MTAEPCQWAACHERVATLEDGYWHCRTHLTWHRKLERGEDPPPTLPPRAWQPCGTAAAARRHYRRGETLCDPCRQASQHERAQGRQT